MADVFENKCLQNIFTKTYLRKHIYENIFAKHIHETHICKNISTKKYLQKYIYENISSYEKSMTLQVMLSLF